ncbi:glycoside hydrolase family 44 protein [Cohnella cellulosilytica]|uniref:Glycoside hydrolase family 44 protein n=1 Tax=Cohnella cellulosilytica TaxID=986710 RepID=A0ABW2FC34_9BACL
MNSGIENGKLRKKTKGWLLLSVLLLLTNAWGLGPDNRAEASSDKLIIYEEQLNEAFEDYSWAQVDLAESGVVHGGSRSIRMKPDDDDGLYLYSNRAIFTADYSALEFWANGGAGGGQQLEIVLQSGGEPIVALPLSASSFVRDQWTKVSVDLQGLQTIAGVFDGILIRGTAGKQQADVYLDDLMLLGGPKEDQESPGSEDDPVVVPDESEEPSTGEDETPAGGGTHSPEYGEADIMVYEDNGLNPAFQDNSWAQHNWQDTAYVYAGESAVSFDPGNRGGLYMYKDSGVVEVKAYDRLVFWINGGAAGGQRIDLVFNSGGEEAARMDVGGLIEGGRIPAKGWTQVTVDLQALQLKNGIFDGILFQGAKDGAQAAVYLDDIQLLEKYVAPPALIEGVLSQYGMVLAPGDQAALSFEARYADGTSADVSRQAVWTSSDPSVATVEQGTLTAVGAGLVKITAAYGEANAAMYAQVTNYEAEPVFDDHLAAGYSDWSWGTQNFANSAPVASGSRSISFAAKGYEGIWMHRDVTMDLTGFYGLTLKVYGGSGGGQQLRVNLMDGRNFVGDFDLSVQLPEGVPADRWTEVKLKFADLGMSELSFDGIVVSAWGEEDQGTVYFDDVSLLKTTSPIQLPEPELPAVQVTIDSAQPLNTLSPGIFGLNFEDSPSDNRSEIRVPIKRWGGNQMTRYNWQLNTTNRGGDWYFLNVPYDDEGPSKLPEETLSDRFIRDSIDTDTEVLLQLPTIGWTPKSREIGWSFSERKYGEQQSDECDWREEWCRADAGNGKRKDGSYLTGNDPEDTSKQVGPDFIADWVEHVQSRFGDAVHNYALDNEPMLWGHAHWDVHPQMTTYDEVWDYTQAYGQAVKEADPQANIFGPVPWGWCEYFYSALDGCSPGPDMDAHDGKPYLEWLLGKNEDYREQNGVRLIDTLDIHYYPAEDNVAFSSDESPAMTKRRFNSLKSLYDPDFVDPSSWIQEPVRLIPRMRELIDGTSPGMKLSISEYNFGDGSGIGSGLAQAEALALFAREGVDYAMRWGALEADTPLEDAFKLYLDYDGQGSRVEGEVVGTSSSNRDAVGAYTIVSPQGRTFVLLFNKDSAPRQTSLTADSSLSGTAEVYRFEARKRLYKAGDVQVADEGLTLTLPAKSATLLAIN